MTERKLKTGLLVGKNRKIEGKKENLMKIEQMPGLILENGSRGGEYGGWRLRLDGTFTGGKGYKPGKGGSRHDTCLLPAGAAEKGTEKLNAEKRRILKKRRGFRGWPLF